MLSRSCYRTPHWNCTTKLNPKVRGVFAAGGNRLIASFDEGRIRIPRRRKEVHIRSSWTIHKTAKWWSWARQGCAMRQPNSDQSSTTAIIILFFFSSFFPRSDSKIVVYKGGERMLYSPMRHIDCRMLPLKIAVEHECTVNS